MRKPVINFQGKTEKSPIAQILAEQIGLIVNSPNIPGWELWIENLVQAVGHPKGVKQ
jgi:hypothetical protein